MSRSRSNAVFLAAAPPLVLGSFSFAVPSFHSGITTGAMQNASIAEASGVAASRLNANVLWTHNDSGHPTQLFPMTPAGANLGTYSVTGTTNTDWEDIAVGPGPAAGTQYLYIADIGDNSAVRANVAIYRVPEPTVSDTQVRVNVAIAGMVKFTYTYPNGARDAESLFVDPLTKDIYIISKRDAMKHVYRAAYPQASGTLQLVTTLNNSNWITAADISPDGDEIIMRAGATTTGLMYIRPTGGSIADALATTPISIPLLSESQGEGIGFDPQGWGYYTNTEGVNAPIHYFNRLPPPAGTMYWDNDAVAAGSNMTSGAGLGGTGTWNSTALKWYTGSSDVAWATGNDAIFWGAAGTVTLSNPRTVNSLAFKTTGYVITGSTLTLGGSSITVDPGVTATISSVVAGSAGLVKSGTGTLTLTNTKTYTGATTVSAGKLTLTKDFISSSGITINSGATLEMSAGSATVLKISTASSAGKIDLQDNDMIVTAMSYAAVESLVKAGFGDFDWLGGGITSSTAAAFAQTNASRMLGVASNVDLGYTSFSGQSVSNTDILVKFTYTGDANLDGVIDPDDFNQFVAGFNGATPKWLNGDFDYNNVVDPDDFNAFIAGLNAFNASGGTALREEIRFHMVTFASMNGIPLVLPEPSLLAPIALAGLMARRRTKV